MDPQHLRVEVANEDFPNCSYVINQTCQYLMLTEKILNPKV